MNIAEFPISRQKVLLGAGLGLVTAVARGLQHIRQEAGSGGRIQHDHRGAVRIGRHRRPGRESDRQDVRRASRVRV